MRSKRVKEKEVALIRGGKMEEKRARGEESGDGKE